MFRLFVAVPLLIAIVGVRKVLNATKNRKQVKKLETASESSNTSETDEGVSVKQQAPVELFCMGSVAKHNKREKRLSRASWNRGTNNSIGGVNGFGEPNHSGEHEMNGNVIVDMESSATVESGFGQRARSEPVGRPSAKRSRK
ncbi:hypothetical protein FGB62_35g227 [Gracilaria domingensis]|nr:hypothetical protein FGB62_35g227 [Gracilaria domingensis]